LAPEPAFWIAVPESTWTEIGSRCLVAAGIDQPETGDVKNTYQEILTQTLAAVAQAIGGKLHREVVCANGSEASMRPAGLHWLLVDLHFTQDSTRPLYVGIGSHLINTLAPSSEVETPQSGSQLSTAKPAATSPTGGAIDLLLDVELPVAVSFGRAQIPLKDVIKLTTGSIVELNRSVSEPVEVIVNNCVIARGEVVVIEGNYGVRIEQIISPQERLRTLH
jgi:flagellar motor switch protein FliN/FliY